MGKTDDGNLTILHHYGETRCRLVASDPLQGFSEKAMAPHSSTLAWKIPCRAAVHGVAKSRTRLSDFTFTFPFHALEKEMATHFSVLAWRIPGMGEPGGLPLWGRTESDTTEAT